jgi:hypothetical protein
VRINRIDSDVIASLPGLNSLLRWRREALI